MKTFIILAVILMVLIPFSIRAEDYKGKDCCKKCVKWEKKDDSPRIKCLKWRVICPCPHPTPLFDIDKEIIRAGSYSKPEGFSIWKASIIPEDVIKKVKKSQTVLDLVSRYFYFLAILPALWIVRQIFFRWR